MFRVCGCVYCDIHNVTQTYPNFNVTQGKYNNTGYFLMILNQAEGFPKTTVLVYDSFLIVSFLAINYNKPMTHSSRYVALLLDDSSGIEFIYYCLDISIFSINKPMF
jgi:hypothetical protein